MKPSFHSKKHRTIHPFLFFAITYLYCYIIVFTSVFVSIIVFSLYKPLTINLLPKFLCMILAISILINHCSLKILKSKTNHSINHFLECAKALSTIITLFSLITELTTVGNIKDAYSQQVITTIDSWTTQSFIFGILAMNFHILHFWYHFLHSFQPKKRSATHLKYAKRHRRNRSLRKTKKRVKNPYHSSSQNILFRYLRREWIFPSSPIRKSFSITTKTVSNKKKNKRKNG